MKNDTKMEIWTQSSNRDGYITTIETFEMKMASTIAYGGIDGVSWSSGV